MGSTLIYLVTSYIVCMQMYDYLIQKYYIQFIFII